MSRKPTTGMTPGAHGSPWSRIDEVEKAFTDRCDVLEESLNNLASQVSELLGYVKSHEAKLEAVEEDLTTIDADLSEHRSELELMKKKPAAKKPARKTGAEDGSKD